MKNKDITYLLIELNKLLPPEGKEMLQNLIQALLDELDKVSLKIKPN